jgi:hypothetical protein
LSLQSFWADRWKRGSVGRGQHISAHSTARAKKRWYMVIWSTGAKSPSKTVSNSAQNGSYCPGNKCGEVDCSLLAISKRCVRIITAASRPLLLPSFPLDACLLCTAISKWRRDVVHIGQAVTVRNQMPFLNATLCHRC